MSDTSTDDAATMLDRIDDDLHAHGEVHLTIADVDGEVEARLGQTEIDPEAGLLAINDGTTTHTFTAAEIVHWYRPMAVFHD